MPYDNIVALDHNPSNPFTTSFDSSALNFNVKSCDIYIPDSLKECSDKKAICKLDADGEVIDWWVVGKDYFVKSHREFFGSVEQRILEHISPEHVEGVQIQTKTARNGRWGFREYKFPNVNIPLKTNTGFNTSIEMRIVAWSGLDGSTANNYMLGAIDRYCLNGMVFSRLGGRDEGFVKVYKRNSKLFSLSDFSFHLGDAVNLFYNKSNEYTAMAAKPLSLISGIEFIESMKTFSKSKIEGMKELYTREVITRGNNVFALHSALTNYSSHTNSDLFRSRKTKRDDVTAEIMFKREEEVTMIVESNQWNNLLVA